MNYEEKYKEALEKVKGLLKDQEMALHAREKLANVFPELNESEDERIRVGIIALLKFGLEDGSAIAPGFNETKEQALAWLEKQGEQKAEMIDKAFEWLRNNLRNYVVVSPDGVACLGHWENDFRKAMKGGKE